MRTRMSKRRGVRSWRDGDTTCLPIRGRTHRPRRRRARAAGCPSRGDACARRSRGRFRRRRPASRQTTNCKRPWAAEPSGGSVKGAEHTRTPTQTRIQRESDKRQAASHPASQPVSVLCMCCTCTCTCASVPVPVLPLRAPRLASARLPLRRCGRCGACGWGRPSSCAAPCLG